jgi:hypothetical protein
MEGNLQGASQAGVIAHAAGLTVFGVGDDGFIGSFSEPEHVHRANIDAVPAADALI